jgi:hypothetical protein
MSTRILGRTWMECLSFDHFDHHYCHTLVHIKCRRFSTIRAILRVWIILVAVCMCTFIYWLFYMETADMEAVEQMPMEVVDMEAVVTSSNKIKIDNKVKSFKAEDKVYLFRSIIFILSS